MSFKTYRDIRLNINGNQIHANNLNLSQEADLSRPIQEGESLSNRNTSKGPIKNSLTFDFWLTGRDFFKDYIYTNQDYPLTGNINGLNFNLGYLENYSLRGKSNSPVLINVGLIVCDEISGLFNNINPSSPPINVQIFNFNEATLSDNNLNITDFQFNYRADIKPVYVQTESGNNINPYRIVFGPKEISVNFISDSQDLILPYTGQLYNLSLTCKNSAQTISEIYSVSGFINKKDFTISENDISQTSYSITQSHLNQTPIINTVDTSVYPTNNYILINSLNKTTNGFLSEINNNSLIERVILGDRDLKFNISRDISNDILTGYIDNLTVNGNLQLQTSEGIITYPTPISLNFPQTFVSGFNPLSGNFGNTITITGTNFNRIDTVLFNGVKANFKISINNTGNTHILTAAVPLNAEVGPITVLSTLRNKSGISNNVFYPQASIYGFNPVTGLWGETVTISGSNFSGISGLFFNGVRSPSFKVLNNNLITGQIPLTGAGYTKGLITISGINGIASSYNFYKPYFPITGISAISGTIANDMAIYCKVVDTGFLCPFNGGFKVSFGVVATAFYKSGDYALTGLIPSGYFDGQKIFIYEPDGVTQYTPFTGGIKQIGPPPIISGVTPNNLQLLKTVNLSLDGYFFKDFFGLPWYASLRGSGFTGNYDLNTIQTNSFGTQLTISDVNVTGGTGYYNLVVRNFAGSGIFTGIKVGKPINIANTLGTASHSPTNPVNYPPGNAINNNFSDYSATNAYRNERGAWWKVTFPTIQDIRKVKLTVDLPDKINFNFPNNVSLNSNLQGYVEYYDLGLNPIYGFNSGVDLFSYELNRISNPITGIKEVRIYGTGHSSSTIGNYTLALNEVEIY